MCSMPMRTLSPLPEQEGQCSPCSTRSLSPSPFSARRRSSLHSSDGSRRARRSRPSTLWHALPGQQCTLFCITFRRNDKLNVLNADPAALHLIRNMIVSFWPNGLKKESKVSSRCVQFTFNGQPFAASTKKVDATNVRRLCASWLAGLARAGWLLVCSCDLSSNLDLTTWIFVSNRTDGLTNVQLLEYSQIDTSLVCVSMSKKDRLQMINGPDELCDELQSACGSWLQDAQHDHKDTFRFRSAFVVKIYGKPWHSDQIAQIVGGRRILLNVFRRFHQHRCYYYGCVNAKGTADSIFFRFSPTSDSYGCYSMLSLSGDDRLILIDLPVDVQSAVIRLLQGHWHGGVRSVKPIEKKLTCQEVWLGARPWNSEGEQQARARLMLAGVFELLVAHGWSVLCALDLSRRKDDTAALVLRSCAPCAHTTYLCLTPAEPNLLWLLNCPDAVLTRLITLVRATWTSGIIKQSHKEFGFEWMLSGDPWLPKKGRPDGRSLVLAIAQDLLRDGWTCVTSADVSSKCEPEGATDVPAPLDLHAVYFAKMLPPSLPVPASALLIDSSDATLV